jgi:hypothetical protein
MNYIDSLNTTAGPNHNRHLVLNNMNHLTTNPMVGSNKKLGSIMGIAKRSRSIHLSQCPSKSNR